MSWTLELKSESQSPFRAVVGILRRNDSLLICERPKHKSYAGYWEFPGGKIEPTESEQEALIRELKEEIGILVLSSQRWFTHSHVYPERTVELSLWQVTSFLGEPYGAEEQKVRWATLPEIQEMRVLEGNVAVLEKLNCLLF